MASGRIITLTTDFGYKDPFVGEMKGIVLTINPDVSIVDVTHDIDPQDVEQGAFIIGTSCRYFPIGTVHVAVVDPGVGSERRAIIVEADGSYYVGPDNGIFSYIISSSKSLKAVHITEEKYMLSKDSPTFQGRDLFAPVAAWLSKGLSIESFGPAIADIKRFEIPSPIIEKAKITGSVIYIDRFGNAITNIRKDDISSFGEHLKVEVKGEDVRFLKYYAQADVGALACLVNSSGHLEIFVNRGSAAREFDISKGEKVIVRAIIIPK
jgi:S-adenosylmethionine hydrolase